MGSEWMSATEANEDAVVEAAIVEAHGVAAVRIADEDEAEDVTAAAVGIV